VTSIGFSAFHTVTNLTSITIPNSVTEIEFSAFHGCTKLTTVTFESPSSLTTIGYGAFAYCFVLTSFTIPNGVTTIGGDAFRECRLLGLTTIPNSVTFIGAGAFRDARLGEITFEAPSSLTTIGVEAFRNAIDVGNIILPNSVTTIGDRAFMREIMFILIYIPDSVTTMGAGVFSGWAHGYIYAEAPSRPTDWAVDWSSGIIHSTVRFNTTLSESDNLLFNFNPFASEYLVTLSLFNDTELNIPNYFRGSPVRLLMPGKFPGRNTLTSVTIPSNVSYIPEGTFQRCINLTTVTIESPSNLTQISNYTFIDCTSLTSINIPNSVFLIGDGAFSYCTNLTTVTFESQSNLERIDQAAFFGCRSLTEITLPNSVIVIEASAFRGCSSMTSIYIPRSVTTIGSDAFRDCTSLTIYAEAPSQPAGWHAWWNRNNRPVVWGHVVSDYDITEIVHATTLVGNYPNPFNPQTTIKFEIGNGKLENVVVDIYNVRGQRVRTLVNGIYSAGSHSVIWNGTDDHGRNVSSGMYFYRMTAGEYTSVRRMMLLK
jgi:hypothetical protein